MELTFFYEKDMSKIAVVFDITCAFSSFKFYYIQRVKIKIPKVRLCIH